MPKTPKVIDVFCYNGEPIVELRLAMLAEVVDEFYIVESKVTFSGNMKPVLYKDTYADVFAPYLDKIKFMILDETDFRTAHGNAWRREEAQRNAPLQRIVEEHPDEEYVLIVSDVDEIPRPELLGMFRSPDLYAKLVKPVALQMEFFYYNFEWQKKFAWMHAFAINAEGVKLLKHGFDTARLSPKTGYIANAGWHCSYFESIGNIIRKIESFSHQEHNTEGIKTPAYIEECMNKGIDLFARGPREDLVQYDMSALPAALREFHDKIKTQQQVQ